MSPFGVQEVDPPFNDYPLSQRFNAWLLDELACLTNQPADQSFSALGISVGGQQGDVRCL
jgi:hypothetical protein